MAVFRPFRALRPAPGLAAEVAAPPYDVVDTAQAAALADDRPHSFLHVTRPEIDLPPDAPDAAQHARARAALDAFVADGVLVPDDVPAFTVYAAPAADDWGVQVGVVGLVSAAEYRSGVIRTHEHTRPDKLGDRTRHLHALAAHDEPVLLLAPPDDDVAAVLDAVTAGPPDVENVSTVDGGILSLWVVTDPERTATLEKAFAAMPELYVADGHHRSEAAATVWDDLGRPDDEAGLFPALVIPTDRACVLAYDRLVADLAGRTPAALLEAVAAAGFDVRPAGPLRPDAPGTIGLYTADGGWHRLVVRDRPDPAADPVAALDVSVLQDRVLTPVLGIADPRTDPRIGFAGGRTPEDLAAEVDAGRAAVAFTLCPTSPDDVLAVARSGGVMPPKSTWFAPKPYSGLFVHRFTTGGAPPGSAG